MATRAPGSFKRVNPATQADGRAWRWRSGTSPAHTASRQSHVWPTGCGLMILEHRSPPVALSSIALGADDETPINVNLKLDAFTGRITRLAARTGEDEGDCEAGA